MAPCRPPERLLAPQTLVQRDHMQLIHHPGTHLYQTVPMPQQLPQIAILSIRYPDPRKAVFHHESQQQLCVLAIGFLFAYSFRADLGGIPDPQLETQVMQQTFKPACVPTGFHSYPHAQVLLFQLAVKLLGLLAVSQTPFS